MDLVIETLFEVVLVDLRFRPLTFGCLVLTYGLSRAKSIFLSNIDFNLLEVKDSLLSSDSEILW